MKEFISVLLEAENTLAQKIEMSRAQVVEYERLVSENEGKLRIARAASFMESPRVIIQVLEASGLSQGQTQFKEVSIKIKVGAKKIDLPKVRFSSNPTNPNWKEEKTM